MLDTSHGLQKSSTKKSTLGLTVAWTMGKYYLLAQMWEFRGGEECTVCRGSSIFSISVPSLFQNRGQWFVVQDARALWTCS